MEIEPIYKRTNSIKFLYLSFKRAKPEKAFGERSFAIAQDDRKVAQDDKKRRTPIYEQSPTQCVSAA